MKMLIDFIEVECFDIVEAKDRIGADTIVNAAGPTLMGGTTGSVDKAIHDKIDELENNKGYFSITKWLRFVLVICRMLLFPLNYCKDWIGKENWERRRNVVEVGVFLKVIIAGLGLLYFRYINSSVVLSTIVCSIMFYNLADTILYLLSLIILADIQNPSANVIRSMIMLAVNYVEIAIEITVIGIAFFSDLIDFRELLRYTFLGESLSSTILVSARMDWYIYLNGGIKFFFLTLLFAYFVNNLRQREFRVR